MPAHEYTDLVTENAALRARLAEYEHAGAQQYQKLLALLHHTTTTITTTADLDVWLDALLTNALALAETEHGYIYLLDEERGVVWTRAASGVIKPHLGKDIVSLEQLFAEDEPGVTGHVWRSGQPMIVDEYDTSPYSRPEWRGLFQALAVLPIRVGGHTVGVLGAVYVEPGRRFTPAAIELLKGSADLIAIVLYNAQLYAVFQEHLTFTQQIMDLLPDGLYISSVRNLRTLFSNQGLTDIIGVGEQGVSELTLQDLMARLHPEDVPLVEAHIAALPSRSLGEFREMEFRLRRADDRYGWVHARDAVFSQDEDGQPLQLLGILQDITQRKQIEEALFASEARFRAIMELVDAIVFILSRDRVLYVNPAAERIHGYTPEEMTNGGFWTMLHPESLAEFKQYQQVYFATGVLRPQAEMRIYTRSGELRWLDVRLARVEFDGQMVVIGTALDITERKKVEQRALEQQLEEARTRLLANFINDVSHDFRTPITTINTGLYLLQRLTDPERRQQRLQIIGEQTAILERLISRSLMMISLDNTHDVLRHRIQVLDLLQSVVRQYAPLAEQQQVRLLTNVPADLPTILGDQSRLDLAFGNLLENALLFTPAGGQVMVQAQQTEQTIIVDVIDTGKGIDSAELPHIFDRLYRGDKARPSGGVGLGLPIAQRIIELHNGAISVTSLVGIGSTFRVTLPFDDAPARV